MNICAIIFHAVFAFPSYALSTPHQESLDNMLYLDLPNIELLGDHIALIKNNRQIEIVDQDGKELTKFAYFSAQDTQTLHHEIINHIQDQIAFSSFPFTHPDQISEVSYNQYSFIIWEDTLTGIRVGSCAIIVNQPVRLFPHYHGPYIKQREDEFHQLAKALASYIPASNEQQLRQSIFQKRLQNQQKEQEHKRQEQLDQKKQQRLATISDPDYGIPCAIWINQTKDTARTLSRPLGFPKGNTEVVGATEHRQSITKQWVADFINDGKPDYTAHAREDLPQSGPDKNWINGSMFRTRGYGVHGIDLIVQCFQTQQEALDALAAMRLIDIRNPDCDLWTLQLPPPLKPDDAAKNTRINAVDIGDFNLTPTPLIDSSGTLDPTSAEAAIWFVRNNTVVLLVSRDPSVSILGKARKIDRRIQEFDAEAAQKRSATATTGQQ